jgi:hypothetical protein
MALALWSVRGGRPVRVAYDAQFIEKHLEEWIAAEPSLVMEGLTWVARQRGLPDRSRPDLIGVTREGALVVAELKRGVVDIATLSQALHYLMWLGPMDNHSLLAQLTSAGTPERDALEGVLGPDTSPELMVMLIGTGRHPALDDGAGFLSDRGFDVPTRIVTFAPFTDATGQVLLAREVEDHEVPESEAGPKQRVSRAASVERVREMARESGVLEPFDAAVRVAAEHGLKIKPWPYSVTVVPPFTRGRTLIYLSPRGGVVHFGYSTENLAELYGAKPAEVEANLGANWIDVDPEAATALVEKFGAMMAVLQNADSGDGGTPLVVQ